MKIGARVGAPGAATVPHVHAKSAFIYAYVISGAIESKVNDGETRVYKAGESWSEPPGASPPSAATPARRSRRSCSRSSSSIPRTRR